MSIQKIKESELAANGISSLATRPSLPSLYEGRPLSAAELRAAFDRLPRLLAERYNALLDSLGLWQEGNETLAESLETGLFEEHSLADLFSDIQNGNLFSYLKDSHGVSLSALIAALAAPIGEIGEGETGGVSGDTVAKRLLAERKLALSDAAELYRLSRSEGGTLSFCLEVCREGKWQRVGDGFSLPKDIFLKGGVVLSCTEAGKPLASLAVGDKYLDLTLGGSSEEHIFVSLTDLVDRFRVTETGKGDMVTSLSSDGVTLTVHRDLDSQSLVSKENFASLSAPFVRREALSALERKLRLLAVASEEKAYAYETDEGCAYSKPIPDGASSFALLESIGGRSLAGNLLDASGVYMSERDFTLRYDETDHSLVLNGTISGMNNTASYSICTLPVPIPLRGKTLSISYEYLSGTAKNDNASAYIGFFSGSDGSMPANGLAEASLPLEGTATFTVTHPETETASDCLDYLLLCALSSDDVAGDFSITFSDYRIRIMVNEGEACKPFVPFGLWHAPVRELRITGKNQLPAEALDLASWTLKVTDSGVNQYWYMLDLPCGVYCMDAVCENPGGMYLYLTKSTNGSPFASAGAAFSSGGKVMDGFFITGDGKLAAPCWFEVTDKTRFALRASASGEGKQVDLSRLSLWQIERVDTIGAAMTDYEPYTESALSIPDTVTAMEGYGMGISDSLYNELNLKESRYIQRVAERDYAEGDETDPLLVTDGKRTVYPLEVEKSISFSPSLLSPFLEVASRGVIRFVNEQKREIPSKIHYQIKLSEGESV